MEVHVCTFTEHDLDLKGRVFFTHNGAIEALERCLQLPLYDDEDIKTVHDYIKAGFVTFTKTEIEGGLPPVEVTCTTIPQNSYGEGGGYRVEATVDGETTELFEVTEGEPEDMTMGRDLSDCLNVEDLIAKGIEWTQQGREVTMNYVDEEGEE